MAMVSTDLFLKEVVPYCPDVMEAVALNAVLNSAIEFCRLSTIHRIDMTAINGVDGQSEYTITVPTDTQLASIIQLNYNGIPLVAKAVEELASYYSYQDWTTVEGQPRGYVQITPGTLTLVPLPTEDLTAGITGRIALMPTRSATTIHDELYNTYLEDIAMGARCRLHYTPGTTYFDMTLAEYCRAKYMNGIESAKIRANKSATRAITRVLFNRF